jgi:hypothetical protein
MKKLGFVFAALAVALMFSGGSAEAAKRAKVVVTPAPVYSPWWGWWSQLAWTDKDPKLAASNFWVNAGATGAYFGLRSGWRGTQYGWVGNRYVAKNAGIHASTPAFIATSAACAAVSPIVGTIITQRELTQREVFVSTANCFVPILGGWAMNYWFDYYGWDQPKKKR